MTPVVIVAPMDRALLDEAHLRHVRLMKHLDTLDLECVSGEEAARWEAFFTEVQQRATVAVLKAGARLPTDQAAFLERLRKWLVGEQH